MSRALPQKIEDCCPFCGDSGPVLFMAGDGHPASGKWAVGCTAYSCSAQSGWFADPQDAVLAWSFRDELERAPHKAPRLTALAIFRVLKANRKRSYRDIAHLIAEQFGGPA